MLVMLMFMCITSMQAQSITPSKKYITKELNNVSNFSSIRVLGSPDVEYRQSNGSKTTVSIYGSDNLVDLLEVSTVNGVLQVNIKKGVKILSGERRLKVIASSPSLDNVDIKGSADVYLKGTIKGADLNLNITGSGDIEAENLQYTNLSAFIKGSGDIDVKNVKATTVKTIVSGSGDVKMKGSTQTAMLTVNGSGDISADKFKEYLMRTVSRGPDDQRVVEGPFGLMGFGRLAIMGLTPEGMQPFYRGADCVVCNGELYGFRFEKEVLKRRGYKFQSDCDCEILLPLYYEYGLDMFRHMDSEFALIMYDSRKDRLIAARDPIGIRPLFYGYSKSSHKIAFASEMQNLIGWCDDIRPFPIGSYYCDGRFVRYEDIADVPAPMQDDMDTVLRNIREKLIAGVEKRLDADAPVGFLLSGGLDSSLVCSIAAKKLNKPIRTFAIGMDTDAIDLKYARQTAEYLGSEHHEIIINRDMVINSLEEVIRLLGTWDITTIRASMGMYLLCKAIHEQTDVRVLLTGEISDELFGYKYTDYAPTADAFQQESQKRIRELYMYDVLRADRCISSNSIEARVPLGDLDFVRYVMAIDPEKKLNSYGKGKYLLRKAFEGDWLPPEILWREKAAFSDAVGHSMVDDIKEYAESLYTDEEFQLRRANYSAHCMPFTKESLFYREIFEKYYHDQSRTIVGFWMPNKAWPNCNVNDPSARVLANYGASGV